MEVLWKYRFYIGLFIPFLVVKSTTFLQSFYYAVLLVGSAVCALFVLILSSLVFRTERGIFYAFIFSLFISLYVLYSCFYVSFFNSFLGLDLLQYIVVVFPIVPLLFSFNYKRTVKEMDYKKYFFIIASLCVCLITLGILREFFSFKDFTVLHFTNTRWIIPMKKYLTQVGLDFSNDYFSSSIGGMMILGVILLFCYQKLKVKYGS